MNNELDWGCVAHNLVDQIAHRQGVGAMSGYAKLMLHFKAGFLHKTRHVELDMAKLLKAAVNATKAEMD